jgi:O-acetyl-ADP-ribose deacetylase (regulator of RNase III)
MLKIIEGNILGATESYIAHQCNCRSRDAKGVAKAIFTRFSFADCYATRWEPDVPGTINIAGDSRFKVKIINMFAQYYPGKPSEPDDTEQMRKKWFVSCLKLIADKKINSIAMPLHIGCGLAGGDSVFYRKAIEMLAAKIDITLYDLKQLPQN